MSSGKKSVNHANTARVCVARVKQWAQWMPLQPDPAHQGFSGINGEVAFEVPDGSTLQDLQTQVVPDAVKHQPVHGPDGPVNIRVGLVVFQATITSYKRVPREHERKEQGPTAPKPAPKLHMPPGTDR